MGRPRLSCGSPPLVPAGLAPLRWGTSQRHTPENAFPCCTKSAPSANAVARVPDRLVGLVRPLVRLAYAHALRRITHADETTSV